MLGPSIRMNAVALGYHPRIWRRGIRNPDTTKRAKAVPLGRVGEPLVIALALLFFHSSRRVPRRTIRRPFRQSGAPASPTPRPLPPAERPCRLGEAPSPSSSPPRSLHSVEDQPRRDAGEDPCENLSALEPLFVVALLKTVADLCFMRTHGVIELRTPTRASAIGAEQLSN